MSNGRSPVGSFQWRKEQEQEWRLKNMGEALGGYLSGREPTKADTMAGVKGGAIGFALGSLVLPGIGSKVGAAIGAGFGRWKAGQKDRTSSLRDIKKRYGAPGVNARALLTATRGEMKKQDRKEMAAALGMAKSAWDFAGSTKAIKAGDVIGEVPLLMGEGAKYGLGQLYKGAQSGGQKLLQSAVGQKLLKSDLAKKGARFLWGLMP